MSRISDGDSSPSDEFDMKKIVSELERAESRIVIRLEMRRFRKPTTMIEGIPGDNKQLEEIAHRLKKSLATGGTVKEGVLILQGDHREKAKEELEKMGYQSSSIELQ